MFNNVIASFKREFLNSSPEKEREREKKLLAENTKGRWRGGAGTYNSRLSVRELSVLRVVRRDYTHNTRSSSSFAEHSSTRLQFEPFPKPRSSARRPFSIDTPRPTTPGGDRWTKPCAPSAQSAFPGPVSIFHLDIA